MSDISPRRRLMGRGALASAFLAVPLTASICFAEVSASEVPEPPQPPSPAVWAEVPAPPAPPAPPEPSEFDREFDEAERELAEAQIEIEEARREIVEIERELAGDLGGKKTHRHVRINGKEWDELDEEERAELRAEMAELRAQLAEGGELHMEMEKLRKQFGENGEMRRELRIAMAEAHEAHANAPKVVVSCKDEYTPVTSETDANGKTTLFVCETAGEKMALRAMRQARTAIAAEKSLSAEERAEALRSLDAEIAELKRKK